LDLQTLIEDNAQLRRENEALKAEIERLRRVLEEARRAGKRQAAPFSRQKPKANPKRPGRKAGAGYGPRCRRPIPKTIDERVEAPLPDACPHCGGGVRETGVMQQYQTEIPEPKVTHIEFRIHVGECRKCGHGLQGRHPRQTSDAVGGAASQLGPRALALAIELNKRLGLPYGKTAAVLEEAFGLRVSRGGLARAMARVARKAEPTYQSLVEVVRRSPSVTPDETGWKVGGKLWWLWVFAGLEATVYSILPGRGFEQAASVLGAEFDGFLVRDGWGVYRQFEAAVHQTCLAHLLRRCREMIEVGPSARTQLPRVVRALLLAGLELRDRRDEQTIGPRGAAVAAGRLEARLDRLLQPAYRIPSHRRLIGHLRRERDAVFTFLHCPGLDATNWRAEQAIRPSVVARKVWGGSRTPAGARTQSVLLSVIQTCRQHGHTASPAFMRLLCSPLPIALRLHPG
jgi:transposase